MTLKISRRSQVQLITEAIFNQYDLNRNGFLDENEVKTFICDAFCSQEEETDRTIKELYKQFDENKDGKFCKEEVESLIWKLLQIKSNNS